eukprot:contig_9156_g2175
MRFRDSSSKFSGNLGKAWMGHVAAYQQVARDYDLSQEQRFQFRHNILSDDAKRFYLDEVQSYASTLSQAVDMVSAENNSIVRQNRLKNYQAGYRMSTQLTDGLTEAAALEKTYKMITKLAPQVPRSHQGDAHKVEFCATRRRRGRPPRDHVEAKVSERLVTAVADTNVFLGACLDTGAERMVLGRQQAHADARFTGTELHLAKPKNAAFRFGASHDPSLGVLPIRVPLADELFLPMDDEVVDVNVPFLFGLDTQDANKMYVNNVSNKLVCVAYEVSISVTRKSGHVFREWGRDTLYSMVEAERLL